VIEDAVEEDKSGCGVRRRLDSLVQKLLKLKPILDLYDGKEDADEVGNTFLNEETSFFDVMTEEEISEFSLFCGIEVFVEVD
jgi:hypothetical protein